MHGEVKVSYMTEEERLAYIAKHPIIPTEKPKGTAFSDLSKYGERAKARHKQSKGGKKRPVKRIIDDVDVNKVHELYMKGIHLEDIAKECGLSRSNLYRVINEQREADPDKWPRRVNRKKVKK